MNAPGLLKPNEFSACLEYIVLEFKVLIPSNCRLMLSIILLNFLPGLFKSMLVRNSSDSKSKLFSIDFII